MDLSAKKKLNKLEQDAQMEINAREEKLERLRVCK